MTAADRPTVPRVGDTITTAEDLCELFAAGIEYVVVATGWQPWLVTSTEDGDLVAWTWADEDTPTGKWPVRIVEKLPYPLTLLAFPPGEPSRPSVTDNARAEAERRYPNIQPRALADAYHEVFVTGAEWAAGRAETTTATNEDATVEQVADALEHWDRGIDWRLAEQENLTRAAYLRGAEQLLGLLATARTRPTREQIAFAIARGVDGMTSADYEDASDDYRNEMLEGADAVLALFSEEVDR